MSKLSARKRQNRYQLNKLQKALAFVRENAKGTWTIEKNGTDRCLRVEEFALVEDALPPSYAVMLMDNGDVYYMDKSPGMGKTESIEVAFAKFWAAYRDLLELDPLERLSKI